MQCLYYYLPKVTEGLSTVVCRTDNTTLHECDGQYAPGEPIIVSS